MALKKENKYLNMVEKYSLHRLWQEQLLLARNGEPLKDLGAIRKRLRDFGCERTGIDKNGNRIYEVTKKEINKMNKICQK